MLQLLEGPAQNTYSPWKEACSSLPYSFSSASSYQTSRPPKDPVCRTSWPKQEAKPIPSELQKATWFLAGLPGTRGRQPQPQARPRRAAGTAEERVQGPRGESRPGKRRARARPKPDSGRAFGIATPLSPLSASLPGLAKRLCRATLAQEAPLGFTQPTQQSLEARQALHARAPERRPQEGKGRKHLSAVAPGLRAGRGRRSPARDLPAELPPPPSSALSKPACQGGPLYLAAGPRGTSGSVVSSS